jgi:hypothetical protein
MHSQFVQVALPIVITLIVALIAQSKRIEDVRDVLRAGMKAETAVLHGEMVRMQGEAAKNHSELLAKFAAMEDRLDRRIEKLETGMQGAR